MSAATGLSPDIRWFKTTFGPQMSRGVSGTLFDADMLTAYFAKTGHRFR